MDMGPRSNSLGSLAHRPLNALAAAAAVGALIAGVLYATDPRELLGVSLWEKPLKFLLSSVIYALTLSWFYSFTARSRRFGWWLGVGIVAFLVIELIIIVGAAALGVTSHFNVSSPLAIALWSTMATAISLTWGATFLMGALLWKSSLIPRVLRDAIRWGLGIALGGMGIAFAMTPPQANQIADWQGIAGAHAVGVADGGPGLPFLGWSTVAGDLRISHFFGLHALQILPVVALVVTALLTSVAAQRAVVWASGVAVSLIVIVLFVQALQAESIVSPSGKTLLLLAGASVISLAVGFGVAQLHHRKYGESWPEARAASQANHPASNHS
jgi:hypothetical protein